MPLVPYSPPYIAWAGTYFNLEQALSTPSLALTTSSLTVSSINGMPPGGGGSAISSFSFASISSLSVSSINGLIPGAGGASSSNVLVTQQVNPQTIDSNASATLTLSVEADPNSWWNGSNYSFKPLVAGYYFLSAQLTFNPTIADSNELYLGIFDNANSVFVAKTIQTGAYFNAANSQTLTTTALHYFDGLATNVSLIGYNGTGASVSVTTGTGFTSLQAFLIGGSAGAAGAPGTPGSTLSTFDAASISTATISSINGWDANIPPLSQALLNTLNIVPFPSVSISTLTWSPGAPSNQYVPLAANSNITFVEPTEPPNGEPGWRFTKTYNLIVPPTSGLTTGATYQIVVVGTTNWVDIGASSATVGVQFTYNGAAITGTTGSCVSTKKISWYSLNNLYGLSLPQSSLPPSVFSKANLNSAWFLVKFNADIAQQGNLAIQIDSYAYQGSNGSNGFTGRWAYSFPLQQGFGFSALPTTNIVTSSATPRLRSGFTYLLYAGDTEPTYLSPTSTQYLAGASGIFPPSQIMAGNTLRNPYDVYPEYPHFGMTSCLYTSNAIQPSYDDNPYSDPGEVEVASIYLNTSSTAPFSGVGQTVIDFNVLAMGYSATNMSNVCFNYSNVFSNPV